MSEKPLRMHPFESAIVRTLEADNARLTAEVERLRAALEKICNGPRDADLDYLDLYVEVKMETRAALSPPQESNDE